MSSSPEAPVLLAQGEGLTRAHIRLRPTRLGYTLLAVAFAAWVAAVNYSVNLAYGLAVWIVAFAVMAVLLTLRQLLGVRPAWRLPEEVFVGQTAAIGLSIEAQEARDRVIYAAFVSFRQPESTEEDAQLPFIHSQDPHRAETVLTLPVSRRGLMTLPAVELISLAPFGVVQASAWVRTETLMTVFPAPRAHIVPPAGRAVEDESSRQRRAGGEDLAYLNDHLPGQSLQHVAWKQYAKTGVLLDKYFDQVVGTAPDVLSFRDYPAHTSYDDLAAYLCHRVLEAEALGLPYRLELPAQTIVPQTRQRQLALTALALL